MKRWLIVSLGLIAMASFLAVYIYFLDVQLSSSKKRTSAPGVTESEIVVGSVSALTGPTASLGIEYSRGGQTYINAINDAGGIYGRKIRIVSYDDQYDPPKTVYYTQKAILQDKVFALLNFVGTPTGKKIIPLIHEANIPLVGIFSGAQIFRNPIQPNIFNIRTSYHQEAADIVRDLVVQRGLTKIAVMYQYDDFGFDGLKGVEIALAQYGMRPVKVASYTRNTENIEGALSEIREANPEAIIMVAVYGPAAKFITTAKAAGFNPLFATMSFVGAEAFSKALGNAGEGVLVGQTVPMPNSNAIRNCPNSYIDLLQKYFPSAEPTFNGLEGFINAKIFVEGLRRAGPVLTRDSFTLALESLADYTVTKDLALTFSNTDHQGFDRVYLTQIKNGIYIPVGDATISDNCVQIN